MAVSRERAYSGQYFLVDLGGGETEGPTAAFLEVSGLGMSIDVAEYRGGNQKENTTMKVTGLARPADVTLKRALIGSLDLYKWIDDVRNGQDSLRTVTITLLNDSLDQAVMTWKLLRARPVKIAFSTLSADCDIATEELVLTYERLEME